MDAHGFGLDLGLLARLKLPKGYGQALQLGLSVLNQGETVKYDYGVHEKIPATKNVGLAYYILDNLSVAWAFNHTVFINNYNGDFILENNDVGAEWTVWKGRVALRGGMFRQQRYHASENGSLGFGLRFRGFTFDYAYANLIRHTSWDARFIHHRFGFSCSL